MPRTREQLEQAGAAVDAARTNGRSWGRIAMALGTSRQAARERYEERSVR